MGFYDEDPMDIDPPTFSQEGLGVSLCNSPTCPLKFLHATGKFLQNGKPPRAQDSTVFGGSNPPRFCWIAYENCAAGIGTEKEIRTVQSFRDNHCNQTDPWAFAAEDQRWAQQLQQQEPQKFNTNDDIPAGNRGRGNKGGDNRHGGRGENEYRGGGSRGGQNRGCGNRGGRSRGGSNGGGQHQHWGGEPHGGVSRSGRGGRGGDSQGGSFHDGHGGNQTNAGGYHGGHGGNQTYANGFHGSHGGSQPQGGEFRGGRGGGRGGRGGRGKWRGAASN